MKENKLSCLIRLNKPLTMSRLSMICLISFFTFGSIQVKASGINSTNEVQQADITITGKVLDAKGEFIVGASVSIKGTTNGAISDLDGGFTLKNVSPNTTLVVSYLGYITQELKIGDKRVFSIQLQEDAQVLDEVVVQVGYGGVKRANLLGAVANMGTDGIKDVPTANLAEALAGKMVGVNITRNNGSPNSQENISIRSGSSYTAGAQPPLIVVDGLYRDLEYFNSLNPNDVESISVLKDASAAVYGARGAGGVVLVKTKMGKEGKPKLSYNGSFGISDRTAFSELMNNEELITYLNDARDTEYLRNSSQYMNWSRDDFRSSALTVYDPSQNLDNRSYYYTAEDIEAVKNRNYNWLDKYWSASTTTKHNINLSGGTDNIKYFTGLSYFQQDGNISKFNIEQYSFRVGVEAKLVAGLSGRFSLDTNTKNKRLPYNKADSSDGTMKNTFQSLMRTPQWMPYELNGSPVFYGKIPEAKTGTIAHIAGIDGSYNKGKSTSVTLNIGFGYDFSDINDMLKGLKAKVSYARTESSGSSRQYRSNYTLYELDQLYPGSKIPSDANFKYKADGTIVSNKIDNGDRISFDSSSSYSQQFNIGLDYTRKFGSHNLNVMANYEENASRGNNFNLFREGMLIPGWEVVNAFSKALEAGNGYGRSARRSYIGRANYDYQDKYLVETSFRYESSNLFPQDARWGFFPSIATGWRISEEDWYNIKFMDSAKLRASLGLVGDDGAVNNQWRYYYEAASSGGYLGGDPLNGIKPSLSGVKQSKLKWEQTFYQNYGIDLRFFGNLDFGFDFYHKNTWDILDGTTSDYPTTVGVNKGPKRNAGRMRSWGYEVSLSYNGRINQDMSYTIGGNLSWFDTKVVKRIQSQSVIGTWRDQIGRRLDSGIEGYKSLGIIRTESQLNAIFEKYGTDYKIFGNAPELGMLYYEDLDGDNTITKEGDVTRLKDRSTNPYSVGLSLGFKWKSLSFSAQFTGSFGGWALMNKNDYLYPTDTANGLKMWNDHWTLENPNASMPRAASYGVDEMVVSDFWIKKGTELRLRNASISYSFPRTLSSKVGMSDLRLYASATNLFTLVSPFDYKDPSLSYFDSYPVMRTINFGLSLSF